MAKRALFIFSLVALLAACPKRTTRGLAEYEIGPESEFLSGQVSDLYEHRVLNRRDFVYAIAFDPSAALVAFPHMVLTDFELSMAEVESGDIRWQAKINPTEFDVEGVDFVAPDGVVVVAARRSSDSSHPTLRLFDANSGQERAASFADDEHGYSQLAVRPDGAIIAVVTAKEGGLVLHDGRSLVWRGETRAHRGAATTVAFAPDGSIFTGGQDKTVARWRLASAQAEGRGATRVAVLTIGEGKDRAVVGSIAGKTPLALVVDNTLETIAVTKAIVGRAGLKADGPTREIATSAGKLKVPTVTLPGLRFKHLSTGPIEAVVCDECVPVGADGALGKGAAPRLEVDFGPLPHVATVDVRPAEAAVPESRPAQPGPKPEAVPAKEGAAGDAAAPASGVSSDLYHLELIERFVLPGAVNDIRVSRDGTTLCVAISSAPAVRSLELYEKEKAGEYPEPSAQNAALLVDAATGEVRKTFQGHRGFVVSADLSPDGRTLASGGWDNHVMLHDVETGALIKDVELAWLARRVRFAPDGRTLGVAAWTPPSAGGGDSKPAAILYDLVYAQPVRSPR